MYNLGAIMFTVSTKQLLFIFPIEPYLKNCGGSHLVFEWSFDGPLKSVSWDYEMVSTTFNNN
jgi:hypothetical protein